MTDPAALTRAITGQPFDAIVSGLASRTATKRDARAIDHDARLTALRAAQTARIPRFILLSALCVQGPVLPCQHAKPAFGAELQSCGLIWSIVRPTACFKSLSGQLDRLRAGKPFLRFGKGELTACLTDPALQNRIRPIGGPGRALTPRQIAEQLVRLLNRKPGFSRVPVGLMDALIASLTTLGPIVPGLRDWADLARIGRYYATGACDADATPETGSDTLFDFHARLVRGEVAVDRGDHAVF